VAATLRGLDPVGLPEMRKAFLPPEVPCLLTQSVDDSLFPLDSGSLEVRFAL